MKNWIFSFLTIFMFMGNINEEIYRIKEVMGIITESVTFPIIVSGSYKAPKGDGDALHSFDRRKSDHFGGYMLTGGVPSQFQDRVVLNQGKGVNQVLRELINQGVKPDVTNIDIKVNSNYTVEWSVTINESKDGKAYAGLASRGSAGGGADSRAAGQLPSLKSKNPKFCNWTVVLDLNITSPIKIRQYFLKYTMCNENEKPNDITAGGPSNTELNKTVDAFKTWEPGEYKLEKDTVWTYKLNNDKDWEAKKGSGEYVLLKNKLSNDGYNKAMEVLKGAKKI